MPPLRNALFALVLLLAASTIIAFCDPLDDRVSSLLRDLEYLSSRGVDVSNITRSLDEAVKLYEANRTSEAIALLDNISSEVNALKAQAEDVYFRSTVARYATVALILSTPLAAYIAIPRIYIYLWFRLRRGWLVERRGGGR